MVEAIIGIVLGAAGLGAAVGVPLGIERLKKPQLEIVPTTWQASGPIYPMTFASAQVRNKGLRAPFRKPLRRDAAEACEVFIEYYKWGSDGEKVLPTLPGRWDSHPEPRRLVPLALPGTPGAPTASTAPTSGTAPTFGAATLGTASPAAGAPQPVGVIYDPSLDTPQQDIAVGSDRGQVSVAILRDGEAFAFSNESYAHLANRLGNPDWKLNKGVYRIVIRVRPSNAEEQRQEFKLEYLSDNFAEFRLQAI